MNLLRRLLHGTGLFVAAIVAAEESATEAVVAPRAVKVISPVHPPGLLERRVSGEAEIECLVGISGEVSEVRVKSATRPEFGEAALAAVQQWEFRPGARDGQPVAMRVSIPFNFNPPSLEGLEAAMKRKVFVELEEAPVPAEQLGNWPMPRKLLEPVYPPELQGSGKRGKAVVSVVIDKQGRVVNPVLVKATWPEFGVPAIAAAASLEFPPQLGPDKKPVYVSMDVQFDFRDEGRPPKKEPDEPAAEPAEPAKKKE